MTIQKPELPTMYLFEVTCRTEGCSNKDIVIEAQAPEQDISAICGVCGVEITEILIGSSTPTE